MNTASAGRNVSEGENLYFDINEGLVAINISTSMVLLFTVLSQWFRSPQTFSFHEIFLILVLGTLLTDLSCPP